MEVLGAGARMRSAKPGVPGAAGKIAHPLRPHRLLVVVLLSLLLTGCIAFAGLDEESTDVPEIRVGMARDEVEAKLGKCRGVEPDASGRVRCI